jgi:hypothetical protein
MRLEVKNNSDLNIFECSIVFSLMPGEESKTGLTLLD